MEGLGLADVPLSDMPEKWCEAASDWAKGWLYAHYLKLVRHGLLGQPERDPKTLKKAEKVYAPGTATLAAYGVDESDLGMLELIDLLGHESGFVRGFGLGSIVEILLGDFRV